MTKHALLVRWDAAAVGASAAWPDLREDCFAHLELWQDSRCDAMMERDGVRA